jgi:hypothetical protein
MVPRFGTKLSAFGLALIAATRERITRRTAHLAANRIALDRVPVRIRGQFRQDASPLAWIEATHGGVGIPLGLIAVILSGVLVRDCLKGVVNVERSHHASPYTVVIGLRTVARCGGFFVFALAFSRLQSNIESSVRLVKRSSQIFRKH